MKEIDKQTQQYFGNDISRMRLLEITNMQLLLTFSECKVADRKNRLSGLFSSVEGLAPWTRGSFARC
jgi:hypothetical protein